MGEGGETGVKGGIILCAPVMTSTNKYTILNPNW